MTGREGTAQWPVGRVQNSGRSVGCYTVAETRDLEGTAQWPVGRALYRGRSGGYCTVAGREGTAQWPVGRVLHSGRNMWSGGY